MNTEIVDYAMPLMQLERQLKEIHALCLEHKYEEAEEFAFLLIAEARVLKHTLSIMKERSWSTRKNLESVNGTTPSH